MLEKGKVSAKQVILVYITSRLMFTVAYLSHVNAPPWNQDLWISTIVSFPAHLLLVLPVYLLSTRLPDLSIVESAEVILGFGGKIIGALYVWFFLHQTSTILRELGEFLTAAPYPETPIIVFIVITALFAAYAVYHGLETICRVGEIITPLILGSLMLVFIMVAKDVDFSILKPILEDGFVPVIYGGIVIAARTTFSLFLWMLMPYINNRERIGISIVVLFLVLTLLFIPTTVSTIGAFGLEAARTLDFPFYHLVRIISIGGFLERIDALFVGFWVLGMFLHTAIHYYFTVLSTAKLLKLRDYRPIVLAMGTVIVSLSILQVDSMVELNEFLSYKILTWYYLLFTFVLPLLLLIVAIVRKKGADLK